MRVNKRIIAREWLYFLALFIIGLIIVPNILYLMLGEKATLNEFYDGLVDKNDALGGWAFVFAPYIITQIIRSIIWSINTLQKQKEKF